MDLSSNSNNNNVQDKYLPNGDNDKAFNKLCKLLHGKKFSDLPLDFIGTMYFSDFYEFKSILGAGSYAVVLEVMERLTKRKLAMKVNNKLFLVAFKVRYDLH